MRQIQPQGQLLYNRIAPVQADNLAALDSPYMDLLGVRYVVSEIEIDTAAHPQYKSVYQDQAVRIYENTRARPRIYFAENVAGGAVPVSLSEGDTAIITKDTHTELTIDANAQSAKTLIVSDSYFSSWRTYIRPFGADDDQEKEVQTRLVEGNFRGLPLDAGHWT